MKLEFDILLLHKSKFNLPNIASCQERGPVRWPEILAEGLDCQKNRGPVRWPEIPVEGLDCETEPDPNQNRTSRLAAQATAWH